MSTPSNQPPKLIVPSQQLYLANPDGSITTHQVPSTTQPSSAPKPTSAARADSGFFQRLIALLEPKRQQLKWTFAGTALFALVIAVDLAAVANLGDPKLFYDRREAWKEASGSLEGSRSDIWRGYFDNIPTNWSGDASEILQQYVRFNINGLFSELGKISGEMSGAMNSQFKEVLEYDLSVVSYVLSSVPVLAQLAPWKTHPIGIMWLLTQGGVFIGMLANLVKQFGDIWTANESNLNSLELKLNALRAAFYESGNPALGPRDLNVAASISDPDRTKDLWVPAGEN